MSTECGLCKIVSGEIKTRIVYEDEHTIAALDIKPRFAKGQCVVFPKNHVERIYDVEDDEAVHLFRAIKEVARRIDEVYKPEHISIFLRGRNFPHIHFLLFPTFSVTDDILGQFFRSLTLYESLAKISEAELDQAALELRQQ